MLSTSGGLRVAILSPIWPESVSELRRKHTIDFRDGQDEDLHAQVSQAEVVVLRSGVELVGSLLEQSPHLRLIIRAGAGLDNIDLQVARRRGIRVVSIPLSADAVAEHVFALALGLGHRLMVLHQSTACGRWEKHAVHLQSLFGRRLGLIGFGRIGRRVAELGRAFHMEIVTFDRSPEKAEKQAAASELGVGFVDLPALLTSADVVSMQTPRNHASRHLINAESLATMRPGAILINVGRGGTVDEQALYNALKTDRIAGAALDVFEREPPVGSPLFSLPNFLGTPHVAAQSQQAQARVGAVVVQCIEAFASDADISEFGQVIL